MIRTLLALALLTLSAGCAPRVTPGHVCKGRNPDGTCNWIVRKDLADLAARGGHKGKGHHYA